MDKRHPGLLPADGADTHTSTRYIARYGDRAVRLSLSVLAGDDGRARTAVRKGLDAHATAFSKLRAHAYVLFELVVRLLLLQGSLDKVVLRRIVYGCAAHFIAGCRDADGTSSMEARVVAEAVKLYHAALDGHALEAHSLQLQPGSLSADLFTTHMYFVLLPTAASRVGGHLRRLLQSVYLVPARTVRALLVRDRTLASEPVAIPAVPPHLGGLPSISHLLDLYRTASNAPCDDADVDDGDSEADADVDWQSDTESDDDLQGTSGARRVPVAGSSSSSSDTAASRDHRIQQALVANFQLRELIMQLQRPGTKLCSMGVPRSKAAVGFVPLMPAHVASILRSAGVSFPSERVGGYEEPTQGLWALFHSSSKEAAQLQSRCDLPPRQLMTDGIMAHIPLRRVVAVESVVFPGEKKPAGVWHKRRSADSLQLPVLRGKFAPGSVRHPNTLPEVFDRARSGFHGLQAALNFDPSACPHSVGDPGQVNPLSVVVPVRLAAPAGHSSDEPILVQHTLSATAYARLIAPLRSEPREPEGSTSSFDGGGDLEGTSRRRYRGHRGGAVPDTVSAADRSLASATQRLDLTCITGFCAWLVVYMQVRVCVVGPPPHGQQTHHAGVCPLKAHALTLFLLCVCVRARQAYTERFNFACSREHRNQRAFVFARRQSALHKIRTALCPTPNHVLFVGDSYVCPPRNKRGSRHRVSPIKVCAFVSAVRACPPAVTCMPVLLAGHFGLRGKNASGRVGP